MLLPTIRIHEMDLNEHYLSPGTNIPDKLDPGFIIHIAVRNQEIMICASDIDYLKFWRQGYTTSLQCKAIHQK